MEYVLTEEGKLFLKRLEVVLKSEHFPSGECKEATKLSVQRLENNDLSPYGSLIQIFSVLIQYSSLEVNSKMVLAATDLEKLKEQARFYEEIRELRAILPNTIGSNRSNIIYTLE